MCLHVCQQKKQSLEKQEKTKKHQRTFVRIIFFMFLSLYIIRLQVVGAMVLIHPVWRSLWTFRAIVQFLSF
jgi:hypothetical protein